MRERQRIEEEPEGMGIVEVGTQCFGENKVSHGQRVEEKTWGGVVILSA